MTFSKAYEKMLKDGTASKPIKIEQPTPDNPDGRIMGNDSSNPMESALNDSSWDNFDQQMSEYISKKKTKKPVIENKHHVSDLEKRVELLEGIVEKIMKSQMSILRNG